MIHVIGVGVEGPSSLSESSRETLGKAKLVIGSERHLKYLPDIPDDKKHSLKSDLFKMVDLIKKKRKSTVVVLASGDPNLYGITNYLLKHFDKDDIQVTPAVSSIQWAFAMAKEPWSDAEMVSVHGSRGIDEVIRAAMLRDKVGVFTDDKNSPDKIAAALMAAGITDRKVYVCENLGLDSAKLTECSLADTVMKRFSPVNVMIIKKDNPKARDGRPVSKALGIPDYQFAHREGLITKAEVRAVSLAKLRPERGGLLWDIGAGCGSVSIEAEGQIAPGKVFAVEKDTRQLAFLKKNIVKFSASGVEPIEGAAPDALKGLPDPDGVFIGGSSGALTDILHYMDTRLRPGKRFVANVVTLENLNEVLEFVKGFGYVFEVVTISVARSKDLADKLFMVGANPVNIVMGVKK